MGLITLDLERGWHGARSRHAERAVNCEILKTRQSGGKQAASKRGGRKFLAALPTGKGLHVYTLTKQKEQEGSSHMAD